MPVLQNQTSVNKTDFFFLLANVSTLTAQEIKANQISTGKLYAGQANISSLVANDISANTIEALSISSQNLEANYSEFSSIFSLQGLISSFTTNNIVLDGNFLDTGGAGLGAQLLLNGVPIATGASSFSSIADWSYFPAVSTIFMDLNDVENADKVSTRGLSSITISTNQIFANTINTSTLNATNGNFRTVNSSTINTSSITANNINGNSNFSSSNWSLFPAQSTVRTAGNPIYDTSNLALRGSNDVNITAQLGNVNLQGGLSGLASGNVTINGGDVNLNADEGIRVDLFSDINLTASNGNRGRINLTANPGYLGNTYGEVNLVANGGSVAGVGYGGLITITANSSTTPTPSNLTSAVKINAASCLIYSGIAAPLASLAGFTYIYGTGGNSIVAGTPPVLPQVPGTNYIWGEFGTTIANDLYTDRILPSFTIAGQDLTIRGRTLPFTAGVRLSNVRSIYMDSPAIISNVGCNYGSNLSYDNGGFNNLLANFTIIGELTGLPAYNSFISGFSNISGCNMNTNSINNIAISNYLNTSTFQTASISSLSVSSINGSIFTPGGGSGGGLTNLFSTASISSLSVSSINNYISLVADSNSQGFIVDGDDAGILLRNTSPGGQKTGMFFIAEDNDAKVVVLNTSNTNPLNFLLFADNFGYNTSNITGGIEFDISGNTQVRGCLTVAESGESSQLCGSNLQVSSISGLSFINNTRQQVLGDFLTTSNVTVSAANTPTVIPLDTTTVANRISIVGGALEVQDTGLFELNISIQLDKIGGGVDSCDFWIRVNGNDVANTGSQITIQGTNGECLAVCSYYLSLNSGDKVEIVFASPDNTMTATYFPAWTSPPNPYARPAIPAVIAQMTLIK